MKKLEHLILAHLENPGDIFVFPTQVAARQWAEHILELMPDGCGSVAMDRFIAWDRFKSASIKSRFNTLSSVPSVLRQMFAANFIEKNSTAESPLFFSLIPEKYRSSAANYTNWISSLLPQLKYWAEHRAPNDILPENADDEDHDLFVLYSAYRNFLDEHNLFDPAWEKPPFHGVTGEHYIVLYPDALSDFEDYRTLLSDAEKRGAVTLVYRTDLADDCESNPMEQQTVFSYTNSRTELRLLALQLREAHSKSGIPWNDMAVSIADTASYGPYLTRELELYDIPFQYRVGKTLASRGAGQLFSQLQNCVQHQFSYESIKELLTNPALPWKEPEAAKQLIEFGQKNCCVCAFEKDGILIDPWELSFEEAADAYLENRAKLLYSTLKKESAHLVRAKTFSEIKKYYFSFRDRLMNWTQFTDDDDRILGRCISELADLIEVEKTYRDVTLPDAFSFFCQVLQNTTYVPQAQEKHGVHIYEYKAAAAAPFQRHFVLDASQSSLQVTFSRLLFLRSEKRDALHISEIDASREYIAMYAQNSAEPAQFSCAEITFGSFSIPHSSFIVHGDDIPKQQRKMTLDQEISEWNEKDSYLSEKKRYLDLSHSEQSDVPYDLTQQVTGFDAWNIRQRSSQGTETTPGLPDGSDYIPIAEYYSHNAAGRFRVSKSAVQSYIECPRKWYMERILKIKEKSLAAGLLDDSWRGTQLHRIIEEFFKTFRKGEPLTTWNEEYALRLDTVINRIYNGLADDITLCPMSRDLIQNQKTHTSETLHNSLEILVNSYPGYSVYGQEDEFIYTPVLSDGNDPGYDLMGRIDLMLLDPEGETVVIIDYKSGKVPSVKECMIDDEGNLKNLQLAMYKLLFEKGTRIDGNTDNRKLTVGVPRFFKISDGSFVPGSGGRNQKFNLTDAEEQKVLNYSDSFATAVMTGIYAPLHGYDWTTCSTCTYKRLCRTSFKVHGAPMPEEGIPDLFFYDARQGESK